LILLCVRLQKVVELRRASGLICQADIAFENGVCYYTAHRLSASSPSPSNQSVGRKPVLQDFAFVGIFVIVAVMLLSLPLVLAPRKPNAIKSETYECGMETVGETWVQFKAQYYIYALIFAIFDIETIFLLPWALAYREFGNIFPLLEMILFILILAGGLIYAWRKGALEWA
jgi:NADH:ubiquinone oxidoreductase subunit 3 (subunit A)